MSINNSECRKVLMWSEGLGCSYALGEKNVEAVRNINLKLVRGEYVSITGLHGTARNCFANILGCVEKPTTGRYVFDYNEVSLLDNAELSEIRKNKIGFIFPGLSLLDRYTVFGNIEFPLNFTGISKDARAAMVKTAMAKAELDTEPEARIGQLTELQKQKVALARAIVQNPLALIACEPDSRLDRNESLAFMQIIKKLNSDMMTVVILTDKPEIAGCAYRRIAFSEGELKSDTYINITSNGKEACAACSE